MEARAAIGQPPACENCAAELSGPYCHACGAPDAGARDRSTRRYLAEAVGEITDLEHSKLLRTLGALLFRPGRLTRDFFSARRVRYLRPLPLCLAIFALNFFVFGAGNEVSLFDSQRQAQVQASAASSLGLKRELLLQTRVEAQEQRTKVPAAEIYNRIDERWAANATLAQIPIIILLGLLLKLIYWRTPRHLVEHLTFSLHFISFQVLTVVLLWPLYRVVGLDLSGPAMAIAGLKYAIDIAYLYVATRSFYGGSTRGALVRAALVFGGYLLIYSGAHGVASMTAVETVL
jgi:hypothetical protein